MIALHGFLGSPADFSSYSQFALQAPAIFRAEPGPLHAWVARFNRVCPDNAILLGYSMGGRLALHAAVAAPAKYRALIILAAHPGLRTAHARAQRREADRQWAEKFLTLPWPELISQWNNQPVLKRSLPRSVAESDFCRKTLASYLRYFSLGQQTYLVDAINDLDVPILWLTAKDEASAIDELRLKHPQSRRYFLEEGGHRFIFEQSHLVAHHINQFLPSLFSTTMCQE